jgi:tetratricopeptide (TPR) repeat protein
MHVPFADTVMREVGLNLGVATMRRGEHARLWVSPAYGYGAAGSFSFPTVPPNASLVYDIHLLDFEPPEEGEGDREDRQLTFEQLVEAAELRRARGNEKYKTRSKEEALRLYKAGISFLDDELMMQLDGFHLEKAMASRASLMLNAAAAMIDLGFIREAEAACSEVLSTDRKNAKALFRRGKARMAIGRIEEALEDFEAAARAAPGDPGPMRGAAAARAALVRERKEAAGLYKGMIEKSVGRIYGGEGAAALTAAAEVGKARSGAVALFLGLLAWLRQALQWVVGLLMPRGKAHTT